MKALTWAWLFCLLATGSFAQKHYKFFEVKKINDHLWAFITDTGQLQPSGNSYAVLTKAGWVVYDSHFSPAVANQQMAEMKKISSLPVLYVINSHWHADHVMGNWAYKQAYPQARIVATRRTRESMDRKDPPQVKEYSHPNYVKRQHQMVDKQIADTSSFFGGRMGAVELQKVLAYKEAVTAYAEGFVGMQYVAPDTTFNDKLVLDVGGRRLEVLHLGPGNTPGDAVLHLPQDGIICTGDLVVFPIPYCFGSYYKDWVAALGQVRALKPKLILPGHGQPMTNDSYLVLLQDFLTDVQAQVHAALDQGQKPEVIGKSLKLDVWERKFCGNDEGRRLLFRAYSIGPMVGRIVKLRTGVGEDSEDN